MSTISEFLTRWSHAVVFVVSIIGTALLLPTLIGLLGAENTDQLRDRASIITTLATVLALFAGFFVLSAGLWITTTDYRAQQAAKQDTAAIRATMLSIRDKAEAVEQADPSRNHGGDIFKAEREALNAFALSTTAIGYRRWIQERDRRQKAAAVGAPGVDRPTAAVRWTPFFMQVTYLMDACQGRSPDTKRIRRIGKVLQGMLNTLTPADLGSISRHSGNLTGKWEDLNFDETAQEVVDGKFAERQQQLVAQLAGQVSRGGSS